MKMNENRFQEKINEKNYDELKNLQKRSWIVSMFELFKFSLLAEIVKKFEELFKYNLFGLGRSLKTSFDC